MARNRRVNNAFDWQTRCDVNYPPALHRLYILLTRKAFGSTRAFSEWLKNTKLSFRKQYITTWSSPDLVRTKKNTNNEVPLTTLFAGTTFEMLSNDSPVLYAMLW